MYRRMNARKKQLPRDDLMLAAALKLFDYRADGVLVYKANPRHPSCKTSKFIGKEVCGDDGSGYVSCRLLGQTFKVHQIVWLLHAGKFPPMPIDHINRNRKDNRIENLRLATDIENMQNLVVSTRPSAGTYKSLRSGRYCARLTHNNRKIYLGYYDTQEEANKAYREAKKKLAAGFSPF